MKIALCKNPYCEKRNLYTFSSLELDYGVTVFVGCNGCGKSTLMKRISKTLDDHDINCQFHDSRMECRDGMEKMLFHGAITPLANFFSSSEGERIDQLIGDVVGRMGYLINDQKTKEDLAFLFDGIDSGLSVDKIVELKEVLHNLVLKEHPNTYIVFSANSYELARDEKCIYARTGKEVAFADYEDYKNFILKTKKDKDKRYEL